MSMQFLKMTNIVGITLILFSVNANALDQKNKSALLGKVIEDPNEIDEKGNCRSMKLKYTEIGIICKSLDSGDEIMLNTLLNEYYDLSVCRNKTPNKDTVKRLYDINRKLYKFKWDKINMPEFLYSFTYQIEKSKKFYLSPICIPQLLNMTDVNIWVEFFSQKINHMVKMKSEKDKVWYSPFTQLDMNESETMHKLLPRFTYDFSQRFGDGTEEDREKLKKSFEQIFDDFTVNTTISKYLRQDKYLLYAAWMGSEKAVEVSKNIITDYFDNLRGKNSKGFFGFFNRLKKKRNENILTAINALKEFYSREQEKILEVHQFLNKQIQFEETPQYIIDAVLKDSK